MRQGDRFEPGREGTVLHRMKKFFRDGNPHGDEGLSLVTCPVHSRGVWRAAVLRAELQRLLEGIYSVFKYYLGRGQSGSQRGAYLIPGCQKGLYGVCADGVLPTGNDSSRCDDRSRGGTYGLHN